MIRRGKFHTLMRKGVIPKVSDGRCCCSGGRGPRDCEEAVGEDEDDEEAARGGDGLLAINQRR